MAYREPYTVVTALPKLKAIFQNDGKKVCYHFTLTYNEVKEQITLLNQLSNNLNNKMQSMKTAILWTCNLVSIKKGFAKLATALWAYTAAEPFIPSFNNSQIQRKISTLISAKNHMDKCGYKRVTFSQVMEFCVGPGVVEPIGVWAPAGPLRVPHESYYYKH